MATEAKQLGKYLSTTETAARLGVSRQRVIQLAAKLGAVWCGSVLMFPEKAVEKRKKHPPAAHRPKKLSVGT